MLALDFTWRTVLARRGRSPLSPALLSSGAVFRPVFAPAPLCSIAAPNVPVYFALGDTRKAPQELATNVLDALVATIRDG